MQEPIAIVGSACRFPGQSDSPSKLWSLLREPTDVRKDFPPERLNLNRFYHPNGEHHGSTDVQGKSYLLSEDYRRFDASFFNINPREAEGMDPQQRMLLETVYEALESSGHSLDSMHGSQTSVHVGVMSADFNNIQLRDTETLPTYNATGTVISILSNRISYFFNFKGPSVTIDTACSSSLVALHQAVQGLHTGDATTAIVAGTNLILDPYMYIAESSLHMLSSDSRSRMWDKDANGYARGEGFAALMLKPLSRAIMDGDHVEAVIRGTGVNSDGRTRGITMPSPISQTALIRKTYQSAGLDPTLDRCQYFECHGTGTAAGDPVEARAIHDAFFPNAAESDDKLYVGSIKTVIGHLEGCAGLAGVMKAVLAIRNRTIPPNMHFKSPNPDVVPFLDHLQVPTKAVPWPDTRKSPMRVSVNSFGFGGTNAHAIIEGYENLEYPLYRPPLSSNDTFVGPLLFSAHSTTSLVSNVKNIAEKIRSDTQMDMESLTWTLQARRSVFPLRAFFSGGTVQRLLGFMDRFVAEYEENPSSNPGVKSQLLNPNETPGILGIFTGQGAQWASMGRSLIIESPVFRSAIERCEYALSQLPDGPNWSLKEELMKDAKTSRIGEAALSQPLCTALQVAMVELLRCAGIKLDAVVGHSSGEIGAVYAAGIIDMDAAIKIAYYRGYHAKLACGSQGQAGRMMAVALSLDDALDFCSKPQWAGRITVAASNAPQSVTLSGDLDAIEEALTHFEADKRFARILKTDTAYHSHHMQPCAEPYLQSLKACNIEINPPRKDYLSSLKDQYWVDNMCKPVLFSQAVECSLWHGGPFDVAVELGPHPALKGPAEQTIKAIYGSVPAYAGFMRRGDPEIEAFSGGVGFVWSRLGSDFVDMDRYRRAFAGSGSSNPRLLKDLPSYAWDHGKEYFRESRISRQYRLRQDRSHELLGRRVPDDSDDNMRWRNVLRLEELPWLRGHVFQGQVLFPGAGYVAMALEAARTMSTGRPVTLFEIEDVALKRALVIEEQEGVETVFTVKSIDSDQNRKDSDKLEADFACYYGSAGESEALVKACTGRIVVHYGQPSADVLPQRVKESSGFVPVDIGRFYDSITDVGIQYQDIFRGMRQGKRSLNASSIKASWPLDIASEYLINPAFLDVAFQSVYMAFASPSSGAMWAPYLPIRIGRIAVNPNVTYETAGEVQMEADAYVTTSSSTLVEGGVQLYNVGGQSTSLQIEGLSVKAMSDPQPENDKCLFSKTVWAPDVSFSFAPVDKRGADDIEVVEALDRVSLYYWKTLLEETPEEDIDSYQWYHQRMFDAIKHHVSSIRRGEHPVAKPEWLVDTREVMSQFYNRYDDRVDMRLIRAVGENLASVVRGETQLLEVMLEDDMLNRFYMEGYGLPVVNDSISTLVSQIVYKYPHTNILEIGAGTGGTTRSVFDEIGDKFASYTYTDISPGFFKDAADKFSNERGKMVFKVLDIENDVATQGLKPHSYDIVIAANVLHATRTLKETMTNVRSLLKPGGFLIMMEITGPEILRTQFIMGGLPGWWYGVDDGRVLSPAISGQQWHQLLLDTGFAGVDHLMPDMWDAEKQSFSLIVSQATSDKVQMLREPLSSLQSVQPADVVIIGGKTQRITEVIMDIREGLSPWAQSVTVVDCIEEASADCLSHASSVICLEELDQPLFSTPMTQQRFKALQGLFNGRRDILWAIDGRQGQNTYLNMAVGMGRALRTEIPDINMQFVDLDISSNTSTSAHTLVEMLLRLKIASAPGDDPLLWAIEPEVRLENGHHLIPRVQPDSDMNETYNSGRRVITKNVETENTSVELQKTGESLHLIPGTLKKSEPPQDGLVRLHVQYSLALPTAEGSRWYLCSGIVGEEKQLALALCSTNCTVTDVPEKTVIILESGQDATPSILQATAMFMLANDLSERLPEQKDVLVYEPNGDLAKVLVHMDRRVSFASSRSGPIPDHWIGLHPRASCQALQRCLPEGLGSLVDCSGSLPYNIKSSLPRKCSILQPTVLNPSPSMLRPAYLSAIACTADLKEPSVLRAQDLHAVSSAPANPYVVDWTNADHLEVALQPPNTKGMLSPHSTYLLAGMTGDLGLSLSRWMVRNGARNLAITSRNASVDDSWVQDMRQSGVNVQIYKNDISDRAAVQSLVNTIRETMPPIAGVCNACMVLRDTLFVEMDANTLNNTLAPKVDGSKILDEIFHDTPLDFFVLFSSLASIIGNAGQSNYHAANLFMSGLAGQRRSRGLAASIMHIGMVTDVGYVARHGQAMEDRLRKLFFMPISESEVHYSFAEAIMAGKPDSARAHEIIIGLERFINCPDAQIRPPWEHNPRFSHYVTQPQIEQKQAAVKTEVTSVRDGLKVAGSEEVAISIMQEAFGRKLESMMQLPLSSVNLNVPLIDLGCDSLLAIEIRRWFMKEIGIDVPVLKVLSGDTTAEICEAAVKQYLAAQFENKDAVARHQENTSATAKVPALTEKSSDSSSEEESPSHTASEKDNSTTNSSFTSPNLQASTPPDSVPETTPDVFAGIQKLCQLKERTVVQTQRASYAQSRLWFLTQYLEDSTTYNVTVSYNIQGNLQASRLIDALHTVIANHQSLQTCFFRDETTGVLMQGILQRPSAYVQHISGQEATVRQEHERLKHHVWDLEKGETFAATVVSLSPTQHTIIFGYHHIVMDGVSWYILLRNLDLAYRMHQLPHEIKEYIDYSEGQSLAAENGLFEEQLNFWCEQHNPPAAVIPLLPMARTTTRTALETYDSHVVSYEVNAELVSQVKKASQSLRCTPFHFHLAIIQSMLAGILGLEDLCIGVADANRTNEDYSETVGFFLNLLPVRFKVDKDTTFQDVVLATRQKMFEALSNSQVPFDLVLDSIRVPRSADHSPLFQVAVNYRMGAMLQVPLGDGSMSIAAADDAKNPYDISFGITDTAGGTCLLELTTQKQLYTRESTELLLELYLDFLKSLSTDPSTSMKQLPVNVGLESPDPLALGRGPRVEFAWPATLSERFDDICRASPKQASVKDGKSVLTYSELDSKVNHIARTILDHNVSAGDKVSVLCDPSTDAIASMLAILRVGCVYVPLDTRLPTGRHLAIMESCQPSLVLCHSDTSEAALQLESASSKVINIDTLAAPTGPAEPVLNASKPDTPAFLFYTSGTTGVPKGIMLTQANFANHLALKTEALAIGPEIVLQQSSLGFDMSVVQTFCALANGGCLVVAPKATRGDPVELSRLMEEEGVTFTIATPSEYSMILRYGLEHLQHLSAWHHACMGGETVTESLVREFRELGRPTMKLTNCYGPTETTAAVTFQDIPMDADMLSNDGSLVGKALPNYSVYILDPNGEPLPAGVAGEICVGGAGVALGYLGLADKTNSAFVSDSFATAEDIARGWTKMYRTGDRGRLLEDGTLVLMGRMAGDTQVKLRGLRIELDDVANALLKTGSDLISEAIVTVRGSPESQFLVAHVVPVEGHVEELQLQNLIKMLPLPQYMLPSMIIPLEHLPTNANGKVDRKLIATLPIAEQPTESVSQTPLSLAEGELRLLWERILPSTTGHSRIGPDSDFFTRGGNSMLLMRLQGAIKESIGVSVPIIELYQVPTLRQMAARIDNKKNQQMIQEPALDWARETSLTGDMLALVQKSYVKNVQDSSREILMTGSTSFLGKTILESLVNDPNVQRVHCIAVSPDEKTRLPLSDKVVPYTGSLLQPTLGLSAAECSSLQSSIDVIIHAGAHGHCLNTFSSLRTPNLHSTKFLATLALPSRIPIHFISSNRVTLLSGTTSLPPSSVSTYLPNTNGSEGFTSSKWASERLLENLSQYDLPVTIHRACAVTGSDAPNEDALNALLKFSRLTQSVPRFENFEGYFDFRDVREVAHAIAQDTLTADADAELRFRHHSSGCKVAMTDFSQRMETLYGTPFEEVSMGEWVRRATEAGIDPLITGYLEAMTQKGEVIRFPYMGEC
ncbi:hypothetical protein BDV25DRAFT_136914 [Aspergillus avenaceus]|uniref:Hybrid NRPS/PKS enzyme n=1 Tax=Aspergillus avenaceus TaxID=36643 RepID=A0A5N6U4E5_ASPAV|nr:hypothetical protein BDV25DRAFT_136914 [Aspergillus avenaceus]